MRETAERGPGPEGAAAWLHAGNCREVRVEWPDINGNARGRLVPASAFTNGFEGVGLSAVALSFDLWTNPAPGCGVGGEIGFANVMARPDPASLRLLRHEPGVALCLTDIVWPDGRAVPLAPRTYAKSVEARLAKRGWQARVAPEIEFYVTAPDGTPLVEGYPCYGMENRFRLRHEIAAVVEATAPFADCEGWQHEHGPGQIEINVRPQPLLAAADALYGIRSAVREAAAAGGFAATFMAKPFNEKNGSSCQVNISLVDEAGRNLFHDAAAPDRLSELARGFVAGILDSFDDLAALYLPHANSYKRVVPGFFAPVTRAWGVDNRTAAVRVINDTPASTRIEFRVCGGDIAPHLVLPALVAAGLDGIERKLDAGAPARGNLDELELPRIVDDWRAALDRFAASRRAADLLGPELRDLYARVKRAEYRRYQRYVGDFDRDFYRGYL
jgi:glutamine synthetase